MSVRGNLKTKIDFIGIDQPPVQYVVWNEGGSEIAGYCLITASAKKKSAIISSAPSYTKTAAIWHIYTDQKYRRKGYAAQLIESLKLHYDEIRAQAIVPEFKKLIMKAGFVRSDNDKVKMFRWTK